MLRVQDLSKNVEAPTHKNGGILYLSVSGQSCAIVITSQHAARACALSEVFGRNPVGVDLECELKSYVPKITVKTQNFGDVEKQANVIECKTPRVLSDLRNKSSNYEKINTRTSVINTRCS